MENFEPEDGGVYDVKVSLHKENTENTSMAASYFTNRVIVRYDEAAEAGKRYDIRLTTTKSSWITDLKYKTVNGEFVRADIVAEDTEKDSKTYRIYADSLEDIIKVSPCVVPMGGAYPVCDLITDLTDVIVITDSIGADRADLVAKISVATEITKKRNIYTDESYAALLAAMETAQSVLENENATQNTIDAATKALVTVIDNLVVDEDKLDDKTELKRIMEEAAAIEKGKHTDTAWQALQEVITAAKKVYDTLEASQSEVDTAKKSLNIAMTIFNSSEDASTLDKAHLSDGIYSVYIY